MLKIQAMIFDPADDLLRKRSTNTIEVQATFGPIYNMYKYSGATPAARQSDPDKTAPGAEVTLSAETTQ